MNDHQPPGDDPRTVTAELPAMPSQPEIDRTILARCLADLG